MKKVLFLGGPVFQIPIVQKAKEMGLYVGIIDINNDAPAFPYADEQFVESIRNEKAVLEIAKRFKPDGIIIGACDTSVRTGAYVCNQLGLAGPTIDASINSTDKFKMIECFEKYNVPHPKYQVVRKNELNNFQVNIPYPVISKPIDSAGGRGVCIIHNHEELLKSVKFSSEAGQSGDILLEEYMEGPEVSVEVIVYNGKPHIIQITDKITSGEPHFYEVGHSQPSIIDESIKSEIKKVASSAVLAVGLYSSIAHVEIKVTEDGPKMVELGARMGGDCITTYLVNTSVSGVNMAESAIKLSLGEKLDLNKYKNSGICSAIKFIPAKKGTIISINGTSKAASLDNIICLKIIGKIGMNYDEAKNNSARFGYVVCKGKTTLEALSECQKAIDLINIEMEH